MSFKHAAFIAFLLLLTAAAPRSFAEVGFFSSSAPPQPGDSPAAATAVELFKLAPGCDFTVEIGDHYKRITGNKGQSYLMRFFDDGRLAAVEGPNGSVSIMYDSNTLRPTIAVNSVSGKSLRLDSTKGPDFYRALAAQGKLPTPAHVVGRVCSQAKLLFDGGPDLIDYTDPNYWDSYLFGNEFQSYDFAYYDPFNPLDCQAQKAACMANCDRIANIAQANCVLYGAIIADVYGTLVGGAAGAVCVWAAGDNQAKCRAACDAITC